MGSTSFYKGVRVLRDRGFRAPRLADGATHLHVGVRQQRLDGLQDRGDAVHRAPPVLQRPSRLEFLVRIRFSLCTLLRPTPPAL